MLKIIKRLMNIPRKQEAEALVAKAVELHEQGRFEEAIEACRQAVIVQPEHVRYRDQLAHALTRRHDYFFNPALAQELLDGGQLAEAVGVWRTAFEMGLVSDYAYLCIGHALTTLGDYAGASKFLRMATDLRGQLDDPEHAKKYGDSGEVKGPDFVIIGATKCGTTSLYEYMKGHPQVLPAIWKEIEYYRYPERGREWYLSHFPRIPDSPDRFITGEASTCYIGMREAKPLLYEQYPDVKLMALVRDPVDKAISHCHHDRMLGVEERTVEEALNAELDILESIDDPWPEAGDYWRTERGYVWHGLYAYFIEDWISTFSKSNMLVIPSDDLYGKPAETLAMVYDYLGVPNHELAEYKVHLKGKYEKKRDEPVRDRLIRYFAPYNARLEQLMGRELGWQKP